MSFRKLAFALSITAGALALPAATPSFAASASTTFTISAMVPTICRVDFHGTTTPVAGETTDLGQIEEICNDGDGYQIVLETPAGITGSAIVDGHTVPLAADGQTVIVDSNSDADKRQDVKIQLAADAPAVPNIRFHATPKGATY